MLKIYESKDLKKFCVKKCFSSILQRIFNHYDYMEFSEGDTFYLGIKEPKNREVVCVSDETHADFLRKTRDNYKEFQTAIKKKNVLQKINSSTNLSPNEIYSKIVDFKIKTQLQLMSFANKMQTLSKRLQNVFIIHDNFIKMAKVFDNENILVVLPAFHECYYPVINELKTSKVIIFLKDQSIPYKKLKSMGFSNLCLKKESTKHIWYKNIDINQFAGATA